MLQVGALMSEYEMRATPGNSLVGMFGGSVRALRSDMMVSKRDMLLKTKHNTAADLAGDDNGLFGILDWQP